MRITYRSFRPGEFGYLHGAHCERDERDGALPWCSLADHKGPERWYHAEGSERGRVYIGEGPMMGEASAAMWAKYRQEQL